MNQRNACMSAAQARGAVSLVLAISLVVLIGFVGLAVDLGRFFIVRSELQNAVDACALAAVSQLRPGQGDAAALTRAVAYGRLTADGGSSHIAAIQNRANFQSEVVAIGPEHITFSDTLDGVYRDAASADYNTAAYVRCSYPLSGLPVYFMQVLNAERSSQTVSATAVATVAPSGAACGLPVGVCLAAGGTPQNPGLVRGEWLQAKSDAAYGTGNFGWVDFTPPAGGAAELADVLTGGGQCALKVGYPVGEQGQKAHLADAWNSRFGLYGQGGGGPTLASAPPDYTGYAYSADTNWPSGRSAYDGTSPVPGAMNYRDARLANAPYQGDTPKGFPGQTYTPSTPAQHAQGRSRRLVSVPLLDCSVWNSSGNAQPVIQGWACVLMLNPFSTGGGKKGEVWNVPMLEYLGLSTDGDSPCVTGGEPGSGGPAVPVIVR